MHVKTMRYGGFQDLANSKACSHHDVVSGERESEVLGQCVLRPETK
jgi:hypothetical protein